MKTKMSGLSDGRKIYVLENGRIEREAEFLREKKTELGVINAQRVRFCCISTHSSLQLYLFPYYNLNANRVLFFICGNLCYRFCIPPCCSSCAIVKLLTFLITPNSFPQYFSALNILHRAMPIRSLLAAIILLYASWAWLRCF